MVTLPPVDFQLSMSDTLSAKLNAHNYSHLFQHDINTSGSAAWQVITEWINFCISVEYQTVT
jgi:hypothetical protein